MVLSTKVKVKQGTVIGGEDVLPNGSRYYFFRGIPYAVPPLGELRFKAPVPLEKFPVPELECFEEGSVSLQEDRGTGKAYIGSEDCLYLNVYVPENNSGATLPVMVYIHGGGFITLNGNKDKHNPLYLLQEGVIVVTSNYRLGCLGYLSLPEAGIPGNAGLKDQVLVMKWVKENISQFNGDPDNVTLFGHSTGAVCAHLHLFSEPSKKLFHKVIMQSGVVNTTGTIYTDEPEKNTWRAINLAHSLGCTSNDPHEVLTFLQNFNNLEEFIKPTMQSKKPKENQTFPMRPIIEKTNADAVITKNPFDAMYDSNIVEVPVMMGYTITEALASILPFGENLEKFHNDFSKYIPKRLDVPSLESSQRTKLANSIKEFYFKENKIDAKMTYELVDLESDHLFISHIREAAELHTRFQHKSPLYFYRFDYDGQLNLFKRKLKATHLKGAGHVDELCYVFQMEIAPPEPWEEDAYKVIKILCRLWANFAKFNNPTPKGDELLNGCIWEPVEKISDWKNLNIKALVIDKEIKMLEKPDEERMTFWRNLNNYHK